MCLPHLCNQIINYFYGHVRVLRVHFLKGYVMSSYIKTHITSNYVTYCQKYMYIESTNVLRITCYNWGLRMENKKEYYPLITTSISSTIVVMVLNYIRVKSTIASIAHGTITTNTVRVCAIAFSTRLTWTILRELIYNGYHFHICGYRQCR